jgi:hypothetical protein
LGLGAWGLGLGAWGLGKIETIDFSYILSGLGFVKKLPSVAFENSQNF